MGSRTETPAVGHPWLEVQLCEGVGQGQRVGSLITGLSCELKTIFISGDCGVRETISLMTSLPAKPGIYKLGIPNSMWPIPPQPMGKVGKREGGRKRRRSKRASLPLNLILSHFFFFKLMFGKNTKGLKCGSGGLDMI